jgi:hypothetical protein
MEIDLVAKNLVLCELAAGHEGAEWIVAYCVLSAKKSTRKAEFPLFGAAVMSAGHQGYPVILAHTTSSC